MVAPVAQVVHLPITREQQQSIPVHLNTFFSFFAFAEQPTPLEQLKTETMRCEILLGVYL